MSVVEPQKLSVLYQVADWFERYEPPNREQTGSGPLRYVKLAVYAPHVGPGFNDLMRQPSRGAKAWLLFTKMLELVGAQPKNTRTGAVLDHHGQPADVAFLARVTRLPASAVVAALDLLVQNRWIHRRPADSLLSPDRQAADVPPAGPRRPAAASATPPRQPADGKMTPAVIPPTASYRKQETGNGNGNIPFLPTGPNRNDSDSDSCSASEGHPGVQASTCLRLMDALRIPRPEQRKRLPPADRQQAAADQTTLCRICSFIVAARDVNQAKAEAEQLLRLARSPSIRNRDKPMRAFVPECKQRWDGLFPETANAKMTTKIGVEL